MAEARPEIASPPEPAAALSDAAKQWVAALRSGKFKQCRGSLRDKDGFCCLGVANEISGLGRWDTDVFEFNDDDEDRLEEEFAADTVQRWLGLRTKDGAFYDDEGRRTISLAEMNDDGATFEEIADTIEREAAHLFDSGR